MVEVNRQRITAQLFLAVSLHFKTQLGPFVKNANPGSPAGK